MSRQSLTADELLAGSSLTFDVVVPAEKLHPSLNGGGDGDEHDGEQQTVRLRPLTLGDLQTIARAAKEDDALVATLMVQQALVEPALTVTQVAALHAGLVHFLLENVNQISGLSLSDDDLSQAIEAPLVRAAYLLAREYGWTPQEVNELTLGQVLLHLKMLNG
jgi:hypothetical protein